MITSPDMVAIELLRSDDTLAPLLEGRVSTDLQPGGPAIRITLLPTGAANSTWEWTASVQADCWADDQIDAANLAAALRATWPCYRGRRLPNLGAWVSGTWIVSNPMALTDPDTGRVRYTATLGLAVHQDT